MALALVGFVACGEDSDDDGDGDDHQHEAGEVAGIKIGGSAKDAIPTSVFVSLPVFLTVVPQDADGNDISEGDEHVVEVLNGIEWTSSDASVATVAPQSFVAGATNATAEVKTLKAGTVEITATYESWSDSITLTVSALGG